MLTHIKQIAPYVEKSKPLLILSKKRVIISKNIQSTKVWLTYHRRERGKCAKCRICCCFDSYDIWETPYISQTLASKILQEYTPKQEFIKKENHFLFKMDKEQNADLYYCPMLDNEKGCILGDDKPFDCRIWPLRVMALNETKLITLSPVCPTMNEKSIKELTKTANELADQIFEYADENPEAVKPYLDGYPILVVEGKKYKDTLV